MSSEMLMQLLPLASSFVLMGIKWIAPKTPKGWIPFLAPVVGAGLTIIGNLGGMEQNPIVGAGMGLASVGMREMLDQWRKGNVNPMTAEPVGPLVPPKA